MPNARIGRLLIAGLIAGTVCALTNLALAYLCLGFGLGVEADKVWILVASVIPGLAGAVLLWILTRTATRPIRVFAWLSLGLLVASLGAPLFGLLEATLVTRVVLDLMHVITAALTVYMLARSVTS